MTESKINEECSDCDWDCDNCDKCDKNATNEIVSNSKQDQEQFKEKDIASELESYGQLQDLIIIDRDGDKFYVECPSCHSTELNTMRIVSCKHCHSHFVPYYEDGCSTLKIFTDMGSLGNYDELAVISLEKDSYFKHILHGRNDKKSCIDKLKEKYPFMKIMRIRKDLGKDGKDAHGHSKYKRFALIPLD